MGRENLDGFRDSVNLALGKKAQFNERLDRWINEALEELFVILDIEGRRVCGQTTTVVDQEQYLLPTDLIATLVITDRTNRNRLLKTSIERFEQLDPGQTGQPKTYARVDRQIFLHPVPNGEYLLHMFYIKAPGVLTLGTDVTELISAYDRVVRLLAVRNALIDLGESERATFLFQTAVNMIRQIPTEQDLEAQNVNTGIEIARSESDLTQPPSDFSPRGIRLR